MSQENSIKISKFQIDNDGGLLLISKTDELPFLEVNEKGVAFDAGPFTGAFCSLESLSKFIVKGERDSACSVHLKFAEGDVYPIGGFHFSDKQYSNALDWVMAANNTIRAKKPNENEENSELDRAIMQEIENCPGIKKQTLKPNTLIKTITNSLGWTDWILETEKRLLVVLPYPISERIRTLADAVAYGNPQFKDKKDFDKSLHRKTIEMRRTLRRRET